MPPLAQHQSSATTKLLLIGDSGGGKTGSLASLALAGYNLRVLDFDNGLDVLSNILSSNKDALERVQYITVTDPMKNVGGKLVPVKATVWTRAMSLLNNWIDGETKLGPVSSWGTNDILVIDSLSMLANAALSHILALNGRLGQQPFQSDWMQGQALLRGLLEMLYDEGIKCNIIVCCHIVFIGEENGPQRGYPASLGKALSPQIGRYFNTALMVRSVGQGANIKRKILTNTSGVVELKNTAPLKVAAEYPIETGLADYFKAVRTKS
jgi:hypothetical protein